MGTYPVKIQAVLGKGYPERPFVNIPVGIARALDIRKGEVVQPKIVDRSQLLPVRPAPAVPHQKTRKNVGGFSAESISD